MTHPWDENWELGKRLGNGGQGLTHLATKRDGSGIIAAIKTLKNNKDPKARGRMHREVASLMVLSTAGGNVPHVLDHNTDNYENTTQELFVAMEFIPGPTLREALKENGPFSVFRATELILGLCETVELAHSYTILHRDLKPENIIVRDKDSQELVIVDYGLSFNAEDIDVTVTDETFRNRFLDLPETNTPGGNLRDSRSDVTAVCAIYYYSLTGHVPGQLQSGDGSLPHVRPGYSLRETLGDCPELSQLEVLFNRGFSPRVDSRFQSIAEFRDRLSQITTGDDGVTPEDPIAVAERASVLLRQRDRITQIEEFRKPANMIMRGIESLMRKYSGKLGRFQLEISDQEPRTSKSLPSGLDRVHPLNLQLEIFPQYHSHYRTLVVAIASKGEQSVVLCHAFTRSSEKSKNEPIGDWSELIWYDSSHAKPDLTPVQTRLQNWVNLSIQELTERVLAQ